jgi:hypothetical protein
MMYVFMVASDNDVLGGEDESSESSGSGSWSLVMGHDARGVEEVKGVARLPTSYRQYGY